jgi:hypothetical protein
LHPTSGGGALARRVLAEISRFDLTLCIISTDRLDFSPYSPKERPQLARDGRDDDWRLLAGRSHAAIAPAESSLRLPSDLPHDLRETIESSPNDLGHSGGMPIAPCSFNKNATRPPVAGERQASALDRVSG